MFIISFLLFLRFLKFIFFPQVQQMLFYQLYLMALRLRLGCKKKPVVFR